MNLELTNPEKISISIPEFLSSKSFQTPPPELSRNFLAVHGPGSTCVSRVRIHLSLLGEILRTRETQVLPDTSHSVSFDFFFRHN